MHCLIHAQNPTGMRAVRAKTSKAAQRAAFEDCSIAFAAYAAANCSIDIKTQSRQYCR